MTTYALTPQSTATATEQAFLAYVHTTARSLASARIQVSSIISFEGVSSAVKTASLDGLRPEWLNNQMELTFLVSKRQPSLFHTLVSEYENAIYGYALFCVELANA